MSVPTPRQDEMFDEPPEVEPPDGFDRKHTQSYLRDLHGYEMPLLESKSDKWLYNCLCDHLGSDERFYPTEDPRL